MKPRFSEAPFTKSFKEKAQNTATLNHNKNTYLNKFYNSRISVLLSAMSETISYSYK